MIDALTEDTQKTTTGTIASIGQISSANTSIVSQPGSTNASSKAAIEQANADLEKLQEEKEKEIKQYVQKLQITKNEIEEIKNNYERNTAAKNQIEEDKREMVENLKSIQKAKKKNTEIVSELEKLGGQDVKQLGTQV